eukprot:TRINITY_DN11598_c0_g1_i1.p1 TRINITY_DN11598_c0_g1~~TRINITY_DN11598_c0_g1_i1.p1  ORF type:complete len:212 (-),score=39.97 TRINITY_DN11598_c0_g1_i1:54-689(-)
MFNRNKQKTFKPKRKVKKGTKRYLLYQQAKASLGLTTNLKTAVKLPPGEDVNEWLAAHVLDFYNRTNLLFGAIEEFCDEETFPEMTAGPNFVYLCAEEGTKKAVSVPARKYVDLLFTWMTSKFDDETIFPTDTNTPFPKNFREIVSTIFKRMFRVYAFIYVHHFKKMQELELEAHLNSVFKHFLFFIHEFDLVDKKEFLPIVSLVDNFMKS